MRYFAYGSNLYRAQLKKRAPSARFVSTAALPGWRLTFLGWSRGWGGAVASITPDESARVLGAVYDIVDPNDVRALDAYEGCPLVYQCRRVTPVRLEGCRRLRCWTYVMHPREVNHPSDQYAKTIAAGLREHGLSTDHLIDALATVSRHAAAAKAQAAKERQEAKERLEDLAAITASEQEGRKEWARVQSRETRPRFHSSYEDDDEDDAKQQRLGESGVQW